MIRLVSLLFISLFRLSFTCPRFFFFLPFHLFFHSSGRYFVPHLPFSPYFYLFFSPFSLRMSCFYWPLLINSLYSSFFLLSSTFTPRVPCFFALPRFFFLCSTFFHQLIVNNYFLLFFDIFIRFHLQLFSGSCKICFHSFLIFLYFLFFFLVFHFFFSVDFYIFLYVSSFLLLFSIVFSFFLRSFPRLVTFNCLSLLFSLEYIESFLFLVRRTFYVRPFLLFKKRETSTLGVVSSFIYLFFFFTLFIVCWTFFHCLNLRSPCIPSSPPLGFSFLSSSFFFPFVSIEFLFHVLCSYIHSFSSLFHLIPFLVSLHFPPFIYLTLLSFTAFR